MKRFTVEYHSIDDEKSEQHAAGSQAWSEIVDFYGLEPTLARRFVMKRDSDRDLFFLSEAAEYILRAEVRLPTRVVICGVKAFRQSETCHMDACAWQLTQEGAVALVHCGLRRCILGTGALLEKLLRERELTATEVRTAAANGQLSGMSAVESKPGMLQPGSLAVMLVDPPPGTPPVVIAASIFEGALEVLVTKAEAQALLEDLGHQPTALEVLGGVNASQAEEDREIAPESLAGVKPSSSGATLACDPP